jgi:hypothetical protein
MNEKQIQNELDRMDGGLFLDKEADPYGRIFYSIKHFLQGSVSPYTALKWVYPDGSPKPLSEDLISALRAQEGDIVEAAKAAYVNNAAKKELDRQKAIATAEEVAKEWDDHKRGSKFVSHGPGGMDHKTALNKRDL